MRRARHPGVIFVLFRTLAIISLKMIESAIIAVPHVLLQESAYMADTLICPLARLGQAKHTHLWWRTCDGYYSDMTVLAHQRKCWAPKISPELLARTTTYLLLEMGILGLGLYVFAELRPVVVLPHGRNVDTHTRIHMNTPT